MKSKKTNVDVSGKGKGLSAQWDVVIHTLPIRMRDVVAGTLLTRSHIVQMIIMLVFAIIAVTVVVKMLITVPKPDELLVQDRNQTLSTDIVDELELWLEGRNTQYEQNPGIPAEAFRIKVEGVGNE